MHDPKPVNLMPHPAMLHDHAKRLRSEGEVRAQYYAMRSDDRHPAGLANRLSAPPGMGVYEPPLGRMAYPPPHRTSKDIFIEVSAWVAACGILVALGLWLVS